MPDFMQQTITIGAALRAALVLIGAAVIFGGMQMQILWLRSDMDGLDAADIRDRLTRIEATTDAMQSSVAKIEGRTEARP